MTVASGARSFVQPSRVGEALEIALIGAVHTLCESLRIVVRPRLMRRRVDMCRPDRSYPIAGTGVINNARKIRREGLNFTNEVQRDPRHAKNAVLHRPVRIDTLIGSSAGERDEIGER